MPAGEPAPPSVPSVGPWRSWWHKGTQAGSGGCREGPGGEAVSEPPAVRRFVLRPTRRLRAERAAPGAPGEVETRGGGALPLTLSVSHHLCGGHAWASVTPTTPCRPGPRSPLPEAPWARSRRGLADPPLGTRPGRADAGSRRRARSCVRAPGSRLPGQRRGWGPSCLQGPRSPSRRPARFKNSPKGRASGRERKGRVKGPEDWGPQSRPARARPSPTLGGLVHDGLQAVLVRHAPDGHGGQRGHELVSQRHLQRLGRRVGLLLPLQLRPERRAPAPSPAASPRQPGLLARSLACSLPPSAGTCGAPPCPWPVAAFKGLMT